MMRWSRGELALPLLPIQLLLPGGQLLPVASMATLGCWMKIVECFHSINYASFIHCCFFTQTTCSTSMELPLLHNATNAWSRQSVHNGKSFKVTWHSAEKRSWSTNTFHTGWDPDHSNVRWAALASSSPMVGFAAFSMFSSPNSFIQVGGWCHLSCRLHPWSTNVPPGFWSIFLCPGPLFSPFCKALKSEVLKCFGSSGVLCLLYQCCWNLKSRVATSYLFWWTGTADLGH